jgi:hypothetical protein
MLTRGLQNKCAMTFYNATAASGTAVLRSKPKNPLETALKHFTGISLQHMHARSP